jgi:hypothetical protein
MALHALPSDGRHAQVSIVTESYFAERPIRLRGKHRTQLVSVVAVTTRAQLFTGSPVRPIPLEHRMTTVAAQAIRLAWRSAFELRQMQPMWEARIRLLGACGSYGGDERAHQKKHLSCAGHGAPRRDEKSRSYDSCNHVSASRRASGECATDTPNKTFSDSRGSRESEPAYTLEVRDSRIGSS